MSTRTSTRTSTVLNSQRTQQKSQEGPRPFNKRPANNDHMKVPPAKVPKLSRSDTTARRVSADFPAKSLASALKRRQESLSSSKAPPVVVMKAKKSRGKVRFLGKETTQGTPVSQGPPQTSGDTIRVVVPTPSLVIGGGDETSNSPQWNNAAIAEEDETDIVTTQIEQTPKSIPNPDANFKSRLFETKSLAWTWAKKYFSDVSPEAKRSLDLLHLAHTSPQLMEYANWISCCGQKRTWEDVFNEQRAQLVYGILGKILEVHVFGQEMFGADKDQLRELRELDMELVNSDGFYRQRCRSHRILALLPDPTTPPPNFHYSLTALHASSIELLSPLLPPSLPQQLQPQLLTILLQAATLSIAMRRERNVAYHWETHPAVGTLFDDTSMHIINHLEHREGDHWRRNTDLEVVTMAGWPSCVAYRPRADDGEKEAGQNERGNKAELGINRIGKAEVCVTFGSAIKPLSIEPENWLGKRLRVEMTERHEVKRAEDKSAAVAKRVGLGVAGLGVTLSAFLLRYLVENRWILDEVTEYFGLVI